MFMAGSQMLCKEKTACLFQSFERLCSAGSDIGERFVGTLSGDPYTQKQELFSFKLDADRGCATTVKQANSLIMYTPLHRHATMLALSECFLKNLFTARH